jgi:Ca-activated chloride channel family protein
MQLQLQYSMEPTTVRPPRTASSLGAGKSLGALAIALGLLAAAALAQPPQAPEGEATTADETPRARAGASPYAAYQAGEYDRALEGFVEQRVARPEDPQLQLNVGSAYYQLRDYQSAEQEYRRATEAKTERVRADALYNLGNTSFRQGRLEEAVGLYQDALALAPDDQDAKYNLEFVQREIDRRRQQSQERQQQPQQDQQQQQQQQDQQQRQQEQQDGEGQDSDRDGLPDESETQAENPTDPQNPDTDGDGQLDGEEDRNRNGRVDPGETDPNQPDAQPGGGESQQPDEGEGEPQRQGTPQGPGSDESMTPEEAARYLQGLDEKRPKDPKRARAARRAPGGKPW